MCLSQIPESFSVRILSQQDYAREIQKVYYPKVIGVFKEESHSVLEAARDADKRTVECSKCKRETLHVYSKKSEKWVCVSCRNEIEMAD
jgi:ribosomal protein S27E